MNLVLFSRDELDTSLPPDDFRVTHVHKTLKKREGERFLAGIEGGAIGTASLEPDDKGGFRIAFAPERESVRPEPLSLLIGFPRPIQAGRLFKDLTSLGVDRIVLSRTELGEKSYLESDFFANSRWTPFLREGLMQAGTTVPPSIERHWRLADAITSLSGAPLKLAFDNVRAGMDIRDLDRVPRGTVAAIGSERGWTGNERDEFGRSGFAFVSMGKRVLKTETAAIAAAAILISRMETE